VAGRGRRRRQWERRHACPLFPRKHYEDWELDDPSGKTIEEIRPIRDQIRDQVTDLLQRLVVR
jgi:arsenate reductase